MASTTCWLHYYQAKAVLEDNNPIALLAVTPIELSVSVTKSHLDKPDRFRSTIGAKEIATMITVPKAASRSPLHQRTREGAVGNLCSWEQDFSTD
jgi:hypothetical protein